MNAAAPFTVLPFTDSGLPLLIQADPPSVALQSTFPALQRLIDEYLTRCGGVLFRGFEVAGIEGFRDFAASFGHPLLDYEFGSTPRTGLGGGVYTSTEYPPHQSIPLHNEQAYTREWPMKIWFYCAIAPKHGGETPIADSRAIHRRVDPAIRSRFAERGVMYVRNYGNGLDVPWPQVFNTGDRAQVEAFCRSHGIACEWREDGELRTRQVCQGVARHPGTGDWVWFNQAHLFHTSNLSPEIRESLLAVVDEDELPRNAYYGNGLPIEDAVLDEIRGVMRDEQVMFPWVAGDVLMLDNMLTAHARSPFKGARRIVVAMAEPQHDAN